MHSLFFVIFGRSHEVSQPDLIVSNPDTKDIISFSYLSTADEFEDLLLFSDKDVV